MADKTSSKPPTRRAQGGQIARTKTKAKVTKKALTIPLQEASLSTSLPTEQAGLQAETPEEILKAKKQEAKAAKKIDSKPSKPKVSKAVKAGGSEVVKSPQKRRSRLERRSKNYRQVMQLLETGKAYSLEEAVELLPKTSFVKFDAAVEVHIKLNVDPKQADQLVRGTTVLPHGTGKSQRVAAFAENAALAKKAGADLAGIPEVIAQLEKNKFDFDILVATPDVMTQLGKYAKVLGPKGLMPNPKSGTVTTSLEKTIKELKAGRLEFRVDTAGIIHQVIGRVSFKPAQLADNLLALLRAVQQARPASVKTAYFGRASLTTTMGPSLKLDIAKIISQL